MFRKGKGKKAKRERCASYNDEDILGKGTRTELEDARREMEMAGNENIVAENGEVPKGRAVLVETGKGLELDNEKPSMKADGSLYAFMVGGMSVGKENRD